MNTLQYYHRLSMGSINYGPVTIDVTTEVQRDAYVEIYDFCHKQNSSSTEFSMSNEVSISGVIKTFEIAGSHSNSFSKVSTKATQEGKEIKTYEREFYSQKNSTSRTLKEDECLVHYVLIDLLCYTVNGGTEKYYAHIPRSDTIVEALDKEALEQISKGSIHIEKDTFDVVASRYPNIELDIIPDLARKLTPLNMNQALGTRKTSSYEESYSDRGTGSRADLSVFRPKLFDKEHRIVYIATTSRSYSKEGLVVSEGMYNKKPALAPPRHFECEWTDAKTGGNRDGSLWKAIPPSSDYVALSDVAVHRSNSGLAPGVTMAAHKIDSNFMCILKSLCVETELCSNPIWTDSGSGGKYDGATWSIAGSLGMRVSRGKNDRPSHQQYKLK